MRIFRILPILAALAGARASSLDGRDPGPHPLDTRALVDVCAALDVDLEVPLLGIPVLAGKIDVCLCLSAIPTFLETNLVAIIAVELVGSKEVTAIITALINSAAPKTKCSYPEHAVPACVAGDPCGFSCKDGFVPFPTKKPTSCVCSPPNVVCNGICGHPKSCPTSKPVAKREKRWEGSGACNARGDGYMACGVFGGAGRAWECLNTAVELESCGGCVLPLTPYTPVGVDCTALPGVADVSCLTGSCLVHRCLPGYTLAKDATHCIHERSKMSSAHAYPEISQDPPAIQYGLEHVPLKA